MNPLPAVPVDAPVTPQQLARWLLQGEQQAAEVAALLHDQLGGLLTVAGMHLQRSRLSADARDAVLQSVRRAAEVNRAATLRLHPPLLQHLGPGVALQVAVDARCRQAGVQPLIELGETLPVAPFPIAMALYRCGLQAVENALAHARSDCISLQLDCDGQQWHLQVTDQGVGCDPATAIAAGGSLGLFGAWFGALGGRLQLCAAPGAGCRVEGWLPVTVRAATGDATRS